MTRDEVTARLEMMFQECSFPQKRCKGDCCTCSKAIEALSAEPKWNCTANFIAEQLEKFNEMPQGEKIAFIKRFFGIVDKESKVDNAENPKCDLISRADAIEAVASRDSTDGHTLRFAGREITDLLSALPSADIPIPQDLTTEQWDKYIEECRLLRETLSADRPSGEWYQIKDHKIMGEGYMWHCSICDYKVYQDSSKDYPTENYCPNCGARMENTK